MAENESELTRILRDGAEAEEAPDQLYSIVYDELRGIAQRRMSSERAGHTLQATALVNEAYMKLVGDEAVEWQGRRHFYSAAAEAMRRILIDHARRVKSQKRGGDQVRVTLGAEGSSTELDFRDIVSLNDALSTLEKEDERAAAVTRLRFFSGLSMEEVASALEISVRTAHREWTYARARLFELLDDNAGEQ